MKSWKVSVLQVFFSIPSSRLNISTSCSENGFDSYLLLDERLLLCILRAINSFYIVLIFFSVSPNQEI
nr:MAG TPA: hypothetical protein [Caudoviricetes sp.]